jgi:ribosomal protein S18 acetylase RimI-like enzyme
MPGTKETIASSFCSLEEFVFLVYKPVTADQYDELLQLMEADSAGYLQDTLSLMQMTRAQFAHLFRTVGQVYTINQDDQLTGFYWIEERGKVLHLHGLILKPSFQGRRIGTEVLQMLIVCYQDRMDTLELGVHQSNERARKLYQRLGFEVVKFREDLGYYIMQKNLAGRGS